MSRHLFAILAIFLLGKLEVLLRFADCEWRAYFTSPKAANAASALAGSSLIR